MDINTSLSDDTFPTYRSLHLQRKGLVAEVVLVGPGKGNSMGPDFWREFPEVFTLLEQDEQVRVILIRGEGKHFSYGLDLPAMMSSFGPMLTSENNVVERTTFLETTGRLQHVMSSVATCRKPVVAAITGWCIGSGLDLISACDIRICSADARFSLREVKMAMVADLGSLQRLPALIGEGHTRELAFTGKDIDAAEAARIGLVNEVFAQPEELFTAAHQLAIHIADNSPLVVQGIKRVLNASQERSLAEGLRYVALWNTAFLQSQDLAEAFQAFKEHRTPQFQGR